MYMTINQFLLQSRRQMVETA